MMRLPLLCLLLILLSTSRLTAQRHDYAVLFAVCDYKNPTLDDLKKPIEDAEAIAKLLRETYGFKTEVVKNPTLDDIDAKIKAYKDLFARNPQGNYPATGQLLFFFSGHGNIDGNNGYFLPADADPAKLYRTGLLYTLWRDEINTIECRHILVAIDACKSASFDPYFFDKQRITPTFGRKGELTESQRLINTQDERVTRVFMTSDSDGKETPDQSSFAKKWLDALQSKGGTDGILTATEINAALELAHPKPKNGQFGKDGDGSFLLVAKVSVAPVIPDGTDTDQLAKDLKAWQKAKQLNRIDGYQDYLNQFPGGEFTQQANDAIDRLIEEDRRRRDDLAWDIAVEKNTSEAYLAYQKAWPTGIHYAAATEKLKTPVAPPKTDPLSLLPITGGTFTMGCTSEQQDCYGWEKPTHKVTVSDFYLDKYEVTQKLWQEIMGSNPSNFTNCDQCPVEQVSWDEVQEFLKKLNNKYPGYNYRLPTEAEWEYAAREGGKTVLFGNGKNILNPSEANFDASQDYKKTYSVAGTYRQKTTPVGSFSPNALGLYDMAGNVWEWCSDWYGDYAATDQKNPTGPTSGSPRVIRGGAWSNGPQDCRVALRSGNSPGDRFSDVGFRLARTK